MNQRPRLRTVEKVKPPFSLNDLPLDFGMKLGREIIFLLATGARNLEGEQWESAFADCIGAEWRPSNVGLDDVVLGACAWGAKTVKASNPVTAKRVRLISGRNAPIYSFGIQDVHKMDPNDLGEKVIGIWNERVAAIRDKHSHVRTVVLVKSSNMETFVIFELETILYDSRRFAWKWNRNENLEGFDKELQHRFTWQPSGSQFTILEEVPKTRLIIRVKRPPLLSKAEVLRALNCDDSWINVIKESRT